MMILKQLLNNFYKLFKNEFILGLILFVLLLGSAYWLNNRGQAADNLPKYAQRTPIIAQAYRYAVEEHGFLNGIPCYCNCHSLGHRNVKDCFISNFKNDGKVVFDSHGANCGICYSIVNESIELKDQGKSAVEVKSLIDEKYSQYGRTNKI